MIEWQIDRPTPIPLDLVVQKALNSRPSLAAEMPVPRQAENASTRAPTNNCCAAPNRFPSIRLSVIRNTMAAPNGSAPDSLPIHRGAR